jgi:hypothetical protein
VNKAIPIIAGLGLGGLALVLLARKAKAATPEIPPVVEVPFDVETLKQEIGQAKSLTDLEVYYQFISEIFIERKVSYVEYQALYNAYVQRFNELTGVAE